MPVSKITFKSLIIKIVAIFCLLHLCLFRVGRRKWFVVAEQHQRRRWNWRWQRQQHGWNWECSRCGPRTADGQKWNRCGQCECGKSGQSESVCDGDQTKYRCQRTTANVLFRQCFWWGFHTGTQHPNNIHHAQIVILLIWRRAFREVPRSIGNWQRWWRWWPSGVFVVTDGL